LEESFVENVLTLDFSEEVGDDIKSSRNSSTPEEQFLEIIPIELVVKKAIIFRKITSTLPMHFSSSDIDSKAEREETKIPFHIFYSSRPFPSNLKNTFINPLEIMLGGSTVGSEPLHGATPTSRTFTYPIVINQNNPSHDQPIKNISPYIFPNFKGLPIEDINQFLFEFKVLCKTYDYETNAQKLKLFSSTLKDNAMIWFIGLVSNSITNWVDMEKSIFG